MKIFKEFKNFFKYVFSYFNKNIDMDNSKNISTDNVKILEEALEDIENSNFDEKIVISKKTIIAKLYSLEQTITVLEIDYPKEFDTFMQKIEEIRKCYMISIEESEKPLTFEIDPDIDYEKIKEVIKLENEIKRFIQQKMKFDIISNRLQCLIKKLNILYNTSIYYENEKDKVLNQLRHALDSEKEIVKEFKECDSILEDIKLKERILSLISYTDYLIFKTDIKNSNIEPKYLSKNILIDNEFKGYNYVLDFKDFILDEISDLGELLPLLTDDACSFALKTRIGNLLKKITYTEDFKDYIFDNIMWKEFLELEKSVIDILNVCGISKDKANVRILIRMNINVNEEKIFVSPRTNTILCLSNITSGIGDTKSILITKLLSSLSDDITYKEIYFLLVLFDFLDEVVNKNSELLKYIKKYINKYSYSNNTITKKKQEVFNIDDKNYIFTFSINEIEKELIKRLLEKSNLDYVLDKNNVYLNSFYFKELNNVMMSLEKNMKKNN